MSLFDLHFLVANSRMHSLMINDDIDAIIQCGEERTVELNRKYEGLNSDDLNNFKSDATVQQWEGEDFRSGVSAFWASALRREEAYMRIFFSRQRRP